MRDLRTTVLRRAFLQALAIAAGACSGCGGDGPQQASAEVVGKKAKKFEEAKAEALANKGKPTPPPAKTGPGRNRR